MNKDTVDVKINTLAQEHPQKTETSDQQSTSGPGVADMPVHEETTKQYHCQCFGVKKTAATLECFGVTKAAVTLVLEVELIR